jgi:hypothetical protein
MSRAVRFSDLVEMIDRLPLDQREGLVDVVRKRIADDRRRRLAASIRSAKREHARGRSKPTTPEQLIREIRR